jgi:PRC-barrel domain
VEGTPVRRFDGTKVGTIERVMIDKVSGNVAYAVLSFGGFMGVRPILRYNIESLSSGFEISR